MPLTLTKSLFVEFMDYPKLARWKVHHPDIYKFINKIDSEEAEAHIMAIGQAVEDAVKHYLEILHSQKALDLMPRYHKQAGEESDDDDAHLPHHPDLDTAVTDTLTAIRNYEPILYQPTFLYKDCLVRADFMVWNGKGYNLIEVKAKSSLRKKIKDDGEEKPIGSIESQFIHDISFQSYVIDHSLTASWCEHYKDIISRI